MSKLRAVLGAALCLAIVGLAPAAQEDPIQIGDFAVQLARMVTEKAYTPEGAVEILARLGVEIDGRLADHLTEAEMVAAFRQLGYEIRTSSPDRTVSNVRAQSIVDRFTETGPLDCPPGFPGASCNAVKCAGGDNEGGKCSSDADCPGSFCRTPPGLAKKVPSPSDP